MDSYRWVFVVMFWLSFSVEAEFVEFPAEDNLRVVDVK